MGSIFSAKKASWEFQKEKHWQSHSGSSTHCFLVYEDVESISKCAGETFISWKMQMELTIYIFLKDKLKLEVELIHVMSNRSNLKLSRLQIYRANEILLFFSRSILKRDQSPWTNKMHLFIWVFILQKTPVNVGLKPVQQQQTYKQIKLIFESSDDDNSPPLT